MEKKAHIPFSEIGSIPQLVKDFLAGRLPGFSSEIFTEENILGKISAKEKSFSAEARHILSDSLERQIGNLNLSEKQRENLQNLKKENTFTVTTGHQLNLFSGPVFFIYKIVQTIKTAEFLTKKIQGKNFVPIFWLATEDHDFEEINHFRTEAGFYQISEKSGNAVGRIRLSDTAFIKYFEAEFKDSVYGTELIKLIKDTYKAGKTLAEATKNLVQYLFGEYGLLFIDGDDAALKAEMKEVFTEELLHFSLKKSTEETVKCFTESYGKVQVNPRDVNLFFLNGETRNRIDAVSGTYKITDTPQQFTEEEILKELSRHPEKFSLNALMRPVYQEKILPNIMYIGGNAEVMYWLELKDYFKKQQIPMPVLVPRNSMLFLREKTFRKMEKLGVEYRDVFGNFAELLCDKFITNPELEKLLKSLQSQLEVQFESLEIEAAKTDVSFKNLVDAEKARQMKSFKRMKKRLWRAEKIKQRERLELYEELFRSIHPGGSWQERVYNFSVFYSEAGRSWIDACFREMNVEKSEVILSEI